MTKMVKTIHRKFDWPGAQQDILEYVNSCIQCQTNKPMKIKPIAKLKPIETQNPNELVQIDHLKMKEIRKNGKTKYVGILMMVDHYTKCCVAKKVKSFSARDTAKAFWNGCVRRCGFPETVHSDQGSAFEGEVLTQLFKLFGIRKIHGSPYRPQTQGGVERLNQTLTRMVKIACDCPNDWPKHVTAAEIAYNTSIHESTGHTPVQMWTGREYRTPLGLLYQSYHSGEEQTYDEYIRKNMMRLAKVNEFSRNNLKIAQARMAKNHDKRLRNGCPRREGELVMAYVHARKGTCAKLERRYDGPFKIVKIYNEGTHYKLSNGIKVHHEYLRPYIHKFHQMWVTNAGEFEYNFNDLADPVLELEADTMEPVVGEQPDSDAAEDENQRCGRHTIRVRIGEQQPEWRNHKSKKQSLVTWIPRTGSIRLQTTMNRLHP